VQAKSGEGAIGGQLRGGHLADQGVNVGADDPLDQSVRSLQRNEFAAARLRATSKNVDGEDRLAVRPDERDGVKEPNRGSDEIRHQEPFAPRVGACLAQREAKGGALARGADDEDFKDA
jgi:hypothetical protein